MKRFILRYVCSLFILIGTSAYAEEDNQFAISLYGSFLHTATVPNALFFFNKIEQYDSFELRRALRNHNIDIVVLASDGGSVWEGLNMAGIIHDKGIITYVPNVGNKIGCYSACAFMFFGGKIRKADGILAVHQTGAYGSERDREKEKVSETQQSTQFTVSEIIGFLNEFGTPPWVYEKMFRSRELYEFDINEKAMLGSRADEINAPNLYEINSFIASYLKYLEENKSTDTKQKLLADPPKIKETQETSDIKIRSAVSEIQQLLNYAGCNAGPVDGIWGRQTERAAILFAKTANLPSIGDDLISEKFINRLKSVSKGFCPKQKNNRLHFASRYQITCTRVPPGASAVPGRILSLQYNTATKSGIWQQQWEGDTVANVQFKTVASNQILIKFSDGDRYASTKVNNVNKVISFSWVAPPRVHRWCLQYTANSY